MRALAIAVVCLSVTACGIYDSKFQCPPGEGIGCKPVSEVMDLIVEKEEGADLFVKDDDLAALLKEQERKKKRKPSIAAKPEEKKLYLLKEHEGEGVLVEAPL